MPKNFNHIKLIIFATILLLSACTVVRKYPKDQPFLFENKVLVEGKLPKNEESNLKSRLTGQIEDSAQIRIASRIPWPSFPWIIPVPMITSPYPFALGPIDQSVKNMRNLLFSMGYRRAQVKYDTVHKTVKKQQRVLTQFKINTGPAYLFDTVIYQFPDSTLQQLASAPSEFKPVNVGSRFDYGLIDMELSRLNDKFENHGFYRIAKEDLTAEIDTGNAALLNPGSNPFDYAHMMAKAEVRSERPRASLLIRLKSSLDSHHLQQYRIGKISVWSDQYNEGLSDSSMVYRTDTLSGISIHTYKQTFNNQFVIDQMRLLPGKLYTREDYDKTLNNFNRLGSWQSINIASEVNDSLGLIDYTLRLQPAKKKFFSIDLEGSSIINTSQLIQVGSGRVGIANNFTLRNRNIGKRAIQLENSLRTGIEFNNFKKILSGEITLTNRLTFPWMLSPLKQTEKQKAQQARTVASADLSYIDRFRFFKLNTFNTFLGYEWKPNPGTTWQFSPFNFEFTRFKADSLFLQSINDFPLLQYTYNNGLIVGMNAQFNRNLNPNSTKVVNLLKLHAEESGVILGALLKPQTAKGRVLENLYRFIKFDAEIKRIITQPNSSLHLRAYAGAGLAFQTASKQGQVTLPFFKSFIAGGPNSMRGWAIRKLGIGSNIFYDTVAAGRFNDKYADMQLEANVEYRFNLFPFYGFWMKGAVFTDMGNIWFRNDLDGTLKNAGFKLRNFGKDLAIASGFGARIDFSYFLLRFDLGFPIKDPRYSPDHPNAIQSKFYAKKSGGWFVNNVWNKPSFQFAIGYPF